MADFFRHLSPNVVFVTIVGVLVIGAYVGRQEYQMAKQAALEAECAKQSVWGIGRASSSVDANGIMAFSTLTQLCIQSGGTEQFQKWSKQGANDQANSPHNPAPKM